MGIMDHEAAFLRLVDKLTNGTNVSVLVLHCCSQSQYKRLYRSCRVGVFGGPKMLAITALAGAFCRLHTRGSWLFLSSFSLNLSLLSNAQLLFLLASRFPGFIADRN